jgi:photosystem II stability/assembly factor-like uncharacterized protein
MLTRRLLLPSWGARAALVLLTLTLLRLPLSVAHANGRPPGTTGVVVAPQGSAHEGNRTLLMGVTFGLAVSHDSGRHWRWVCEEAIGGPTGMDALLAAPSREVLLTGSVKGLYVSRDGGCDWQPVELFAPPRQVAAIATDPHNPKAWYVAVNVPEANRGLLYVTSDGGQSYQKLPVDQDGIYLYGLALSAQTPGKLAVAGSNNAAHDSCLVFTSSTGGRTWHKVVVPKAPAASATPTVAISPQNANVLLLTALDITTNGSQALLSDDFGRSFQAVGTLKEPVRNIVFAQDGQEAYIATTGHVHHLKLASGAFTQLPSPKSNACVALEGNTLLACGSSAQGQDGFALARSVDGGQTFAPLMALGDLGGPEGCPQGSSSQKRCAALWANQQSAIRASAQGDAAVEFTASQQALGAPTPTPAPARGQGCACQVGGLGAGADAALWALPALVHGVRRARGRRRSAGKNRPIL